MSVGAVVFVFVSVPMLSGIILIIKKIRESFRARKELDKVLERYSGRH